jgi:hypothetical protein
MDEKDVNPWLMREITQGSAERTQKREGAIFRADRIQRHENAATNQIHCDWHSWTADIRAGSHK